MVPLFNKLCVNTATLLTQSGRNLLMVRKFLKVSLFILMDSTVAIEAPANKIAEKVYLQKLPQMEIQ